MYNLMDIICLKNTHKSPIIDFNPFLKYQDLIRIFQEKKQEFSMVETVSKLYFEVGYN